MDLGINLRFDHQLLAVETEHRVHCVLKLTKAPLAPTTAARKSLHIACRRPRRNDRPRTR